MGRKSKANLARARNSLKKKTVHADETSLPSNHPSLSEPACENQNDEEMFSHDASDLSHIDGVDSMINKFIALEEMDQVPEWSGDEDDLDLADQETEEFVTDETDLARFVKALENARDAALARFQEAERNRKRKIPKHYSGNSKRTKQMHAKNQKEYVAAGGVLISDFFRPKEQDKRQNTTEVEDITDEDEIVVLERMEPAPISEITDGHGSVPNQDHSQSPSPVMPIQLPSPAEARERLNELFASLAALDRSAPQTKADTALAQVNYRDFPSLRKAQKALSLKAKDKKLDVFFRGRITSMVAVLNLYLDSYMQYSWRQASFIAARSQDRSISYAEKIRGWLHRFLSTGELPLHHYGRIGSSLLRDEDFTADLKLFLLEKSKKDYICAQDVVNYVASPEIQEKFGGRKASISLSTGQRWLKKLDWRYGRRQNGMYIDGHEREDIVKYRKEFLERWKEYQKRMILYDNEGNIVSIPNGPEPEQKGDGQSLMVSDFVVPEWGPLRDEDSEARLFFEAGSGWQGYFAADDLLKQTEEAIDIFESKTNGTMTGLFLFDNAPSHQKRAPDALSAQKMPKNPHPTWTHHPDGPRMRDGVLPDGSRQCFYFPDDHPSTPGWFKGSAQILHERGLYPESGLRAACKNACSPDAETCCCRRVLFLQPDFVAQKPHLQEYIESRGHICDFYPKFHCELNFIEQYWGAVKFRYRATAKTSNMKEIYANRSACFMDSYIQGLDGAQAAWANRRYHGHRTLPPEMAEKARKALP
ncbi:hypothetical protein ARMGADRAFT_1036033 [Armillaria gallica]|uniref:DDE-1 domain-containing protein n=1 Tax=Armillaria gallica TaxID=47427 RepID=A0A2H3CVK2_ARMGA|nr:hypothetical protein ARMGADRAFT_1036033 [Armillaria gallica]